MGGAEREFSEAAQKVDYTHEGSDAPLPLSPRHGNQSDVFFFFHTVPDSSSEALVSLEADFVSTVSVVVVTSFVTMTFCCCGAWTGC